MTPKLTHTDKRPMLFYQDGTGNQESYAGPRLRIVFPDGRVMWKPYGSLWEEFSGPCYGSYNSPRCIEILEMDAYGNYYSQWRTAKAALKAMRKYDKSEGYPKADFLGYL